MEATRAVGSAHHHHDRTRAGGESGGRSKRKHVLLIGLEYVDPIFSGNGVLTRGIVDGLLRHLGYDVTVLCARPAEAAKEDGGGDPKHGNGTSDCGGRDRPDGGGTGTLRVCTVSVPADKWRRLDRHSAWRELAAGAPDALRALRESNAGNDNGNDDGDGEGGYRHRYVFCIDWTAVPTYESLLRADLVPGGGELILLVLRVFSRSRELHTTAPDDAAFYRGHETRAIERATATFVLSHVDRDELTRLLVVGPDGHHDCQDEKESPSPSSPAKHGGPRRAGEFHIMVPPLRDDVLRLSRRFHPSPGPGDSHDDDDGMRRKYLVCNVRLSPEKNAATFALLMSHLHDMGVLRRLDLTPVLLGTECDATYAARVRSMLPPCAVCVQDFLSPERLLDYMRRSVLLVHPPTYDAYGMIVAEAASVGTLSVIHRNGVGAASLFRADWGEVRAVDMSSSAGEEWSGGVGETARVLSDLLTGEPGRLREVGERARRRAVGWTVKEYAMMMGGVLDGVIGVGKASSPCDVGEVGKTEET